MKVEGRDNRQRPLNGSPMYEGLAIGGRRDMEDEEVIKASELLDAYPSYAMLVDDKHHIFLANKAVREGLDVDPEKIVGGYCPKVVHGLDGPFPGCPLEEAAAECRPTEKRLFDERTGRWMDSAAYPTVARTREGRRIFLHLVHDVTEQQRMKMELQASENRYREMADALPVGVFEASADGKITFMNRCASEMLGCTLDEITDLGFERLLQMSVPEDRGRALKAFQDVLATGEARSNLVWGIQVGKDVRWYDNTLSPIRDVEGSVTAVKVTYVDVTEAREAHEKLRRSEDLHRSLVEATGCTVVRVNRDGQRTYVGGSSSEIHHRPPAEMLKGGFGDNIILEDREKAWQLLRKTFETGKPVRGFITRHLVDGEIRHISANWEPIKDAQGKVVEVQTTSFDITDRIDAERRQKEAQRLGALASMAGGITHDVNNILAMVTLWANIAQANTDNPQVKEAVVNVIKSAMDGAETMKRLRRFSQPKKTGEYGPVDMNEIVADVVLFTRPRWKDESEARDIFIDVKRELGDIPSVTGNAAELREVLVNLLMKAIEAMPSGGTLAVKTSMENGHVLLEVSDTGIGMSDDIAERMFEPYFSTKVREGSGLGLPTIKAIVTAHGGDIQVKSIPGRGSTFIVSLPIGGGIVAEADAGRPDENEQPLAAGRCDILVVDDESLVREAIKANLEAHGYRVVTDVDGVSALSDFKGHEFDIVFLDLGMPGMNGYKVAEEMKRLKPDVPLVLVTGWGDDVDKDRARRLGIARVIAKPFQPEELLETIEQLLVGG